MCLSSLRGPNPCRTPHRSDNLSCRSRHERATDRRFVRRSALLTRRTAINSLSAKPCARGDRDRRDILPVACGAPNVRCWLYHDSVAWGADRLLSPAPDISPRRILASALPNRGPWRSMTILAPAVEGSTRLHDARPTSPREGAPIITVTVHLIRRGHGHRPLRRRRPRAAHRPRDRKRLPLPLAPHPPRWMASGEGTDAAHPPRTSVRSKASLASRRGDVPTVSKRRTRDPGGAAQGRPSVDHGHAAAPIRSAAGPSVPAAHDAREPPAGPARNAPRRK